MVAGAGDIIINTSNGLSINARTAYELTTSNIQVLSSNGTELQDNAAFTIIAGSNLSLTALAGDMVFQTLGGNTNMTANVLNLSNNLTNIRSFTDINLTATSNINLTTVENIVVNAGTSGSLAGLSLNSYRDVTINSAINDVVLDGYNGVNVRGGRFNVFTNTSFQSNAISNITTINQRNVFNYGYFYYTATKTLASANTATRITINTAGDANGLTLDTTTNVGRITFSKAGIYQVVWNAYLFHGSGGSVKTVIWIAKNGTDVEYSGKTENNDSQQNETNLTSSALISIADNDYIEFYWAATGTTVPLTAVAASSPYPATPSFSCTISIVG
jgi:hypothetical protein